MFMANDGAPPWTFIAGEVGSGERPEDAAVRQVKEETGCEVRTGEVISVRLHTTGRTVVYIAAQPTGTTELIVGDKAGLAEVRWVTLGEALDLLPDMYGPVRDYLERQLAPRGPREGRS
jgi:ADP-ribose pyrophosphatase YjhB (NUDIX family)